MQYEGWSHADKVLSGLVVSMSDGGARGLRVKHMLQTVVFFSRKPLQ